MAGKNEESPKNKREMLESALKSQIDYYRKMYWHSQTKARRYKVATILLGAWVTFLLGVKISWSPAADWFPSIAFFLSTALTAVASMEAFEDSRGKTVRSREIHLRLLHLRACYDFEILEPKADDRNDDEIVQEYWDQLQEILSREHQQRIEALAKKVEGRTT